MTTPTVVVPTSGQTWRADIRAGVLAMLAAFEASQPTVVRIHWANLPHSITAEGPFVYLERIREIVTHDMGTRTTVFEGAFGYIDVLVDPMETADRVSVFADFMRDLCTANVRMLPFGMFEQTGFSEGELGEGGSQMTNNLATWRFTIMEGRL
jgi:hypothetical protein